MSDGFCRSGVQEQLSWVVLVQVRAGAVVSSEGLAGAGLSTSMVAHSYCWDIGDGY